LYCLRSKLVRDRCLGNKLMAYTQKINYRGIAWTLYCIIQLKEKPLDLIVFFFLFFLFLIQWFYFVDEFLFNDFEASCNIGSHDKRLKGHIKKLKNTLQSFFVKLNLNQWYLYAFSLIMDLTCFFRSNSFKMNIINHTN